jgi:hypothetical protein
MLENINIAPTKAQYPQRRKRTAFRSMKAETKVLGDILAPASSLVQWEVLQ